MHTLSRTPNLFAARRSLKIDLHLNHHLSWLSEFIAIALVHYLGMAYQRIDQSQCEDQVGRYFAVTYQSMRPPLALFRYPPLGQTAGQNR